MRIMCSQRVGRAANSNTPSRKSYVNTLAAVCHLYQVAEFCGDRLSPLPSIHPAGGTNLRGRDVLPNRKPGASDRALSSGCIYYEVKRGWLA
jgi:hypothetical protein